LFEREDVAKFYNNQEYTISGFANIINISSLSEGEHILTLRTIDTYCTGYYESIKIKIIKGNNASK
jgi:hypothetical protein